MNVNKAKRSAIRKKREEEQAQKVVKGIFIVLIILAVFAIVCFSFWG